MGKIIIDLGAFDVDLNDMPNIFPFTSMYSRYHEEMVKKVKEQEARLFGQGRCVCCVCGKTQKFPSIDISTWSKVQRKWMHWVLGRWRIVTDMRKESKEYPYYEQRVYCPKCKVETEKT
jgi:hypothetical protein